MLYNMLYNQHVQVIELFGYITCYLTKKSYITCNITCYITPQETGKLYSPLSFMVRNNLLINSKIAVIPEN